VRDGPAKAGHYIRTQRSDTTFGNTKPSGYGRVCVEPRPTGFGAAPGAPVAPLAPDAPVAPVAPVVPVSLDLAMRDKRIVPARIRNSSTSGSGSGISMFSTNNVPPMPMIVREPSLATIGMSTREVRKPMPSVCHGCRRLARTVRLKADSTDDLKADTYR